MEIVAISSLSPSTPLSSTSGFKAVVTLLWPYSSTTSECALLLADPDARRRHHKGQVRVRFTGPSARAIATSGIGIGDVVEVSLNGAKWLTEALVQTPGKSVDGELVFKDCMHVEILQEQEDGQKKVLDVEESARPEVKESMLPPSTPVARTPIRRSLDAYGVAVYSSPAFMKRLRLSEGGTSYSPVTVTEDDDLDTTASRKRRRVSYKNVVEWKFDTREPSPEKGDQDIADVVAEEALMEAPATTEATNDPETIELGDEDMPDVGQGQAEEEVAVAMVVSSHDNEAQEPPSLNTTQSQGSTSIPSAQVVESQSVESATFEVVGQTLSNDKTPLSLPRLDIAPPESGVLQQVFLTNEEGEPITPVLHPVTAEDMPLPSPFPTSAHKIPSPSFAEAMNIAGISRDEVIEAAQIAGQNSQQPSSEKVLEAVVASNDGSRSADIQGIKDTHDSASQIAETSDKESHNVSSSAEGSNEEASSVAPEDDGRQVNRDESLISLKHDSLDEEQSADQTDESLESQVEKIEADLSSEAHYDDEEIAELQDESDEDDNDEELDWDHLGSQLVEDEMEVAISRASPETRREMAASSLRDTLRAHNETRMFPPEGSTHDNETDLEDDIAPRSDDDNGEDDFSDDDGSRIADNTMLPETEDNSSDESSDVESPPYEPSDQNDATAFGLDRANLSREARTMRPESPENDVSAGDETMAWADRDAALNALDQNARTEQEFGSNSVDNAPRSSRLTIIELSSESESEHEPEHQEHREDRETFPEEIEKSQATALSGEAESDSSSDEDEEEEEGIESEAEEHDEGTSGQEDAQEIGENSSREDQDADIIMAEAVSPSRLVEEQVELVGEKQAVDDIMNHDEDSAEFTYVWSPQPSPHVEGAENVAEAEPVSATDLVEEQLEIEHEKNAVDEFMNRTDAPANISVVEPEHSRPDHDHHDDADTSMAEAASPSKLVEEQREIEHEKQAVAEFMAESSTNADQDGGLTQDDEPASSQAKVLNLSEVESVPIAETEEENRQESVSHEAQPELEGLDSANAIVQSAKDITENDALAYIEVETDQAEFLDNDASITIASELDILQSTVEEPQTPVGQAVAESIEEVDLSQLEPNPWPAPALSQTLHDLERGEVPDSADEEVSGLVAPSSQVSSRRVSPAHEPAPPASQALPQENIIQPSQELGSVVEQLTPLKKAEISLFGLTPERPAVQSVTKLPSDVGKPDLQESLSRPVEDARVVLDDGLLADYVQISPQPDAREAEEAAILDQAKTDVAEKDDEDMPDVSKTGAELPTVQKLQEEVPVYDPALFEGQREIVLEESNNREAAVYDPALLNEQQEIMQKDETDVREVPVYDPALFEEHQETVPDVVPPTFVIPESMPRTTQPEEEVSSETFSESQAIELATAQTSLKAQQEPVSAQPYQESQAEEESQRFETQIKDVVATSIPTKQVEPAVTTPTRPSWRQSITSKMSSWFSPSIAKQVQSERKAPPPRTTTLQETPSKPTVLSKQKQKARSISPPPISRYSQGHTTNLSYFTPLTDLPAYLNQTDQTVDVVAVCCSSTSEPKQAKKGPKDWYTVFRILDQDSLFAQEQQDEISNDSIQATENLSPKDENDRQDHDDNNNNKDEDSRAKKTKKQGIRVEVFRPWKASLPSAKPGDVILLRGFSVKSRDREVYLFSTGQSAWCVWKWPSIITQEDGSGGRPTSAGSAASAASTASSSGTGSGMTVKEEIKGPPVEIGNEERRRVKEIRTWWDSLTSTSTEEHEEKEEE